jgi:hypothetical protein
VQREGRKHQLLSLARTQEHAEHFFFSLTILLFETVYTCVVQSTLTTEHPCVPNHEEVLCNGRQETPVTFTLILFAQVATGIVQSTLTAEHSLVFPSKKDFGD